MGGKDGKFPSFRPCERFGLSLSFPNICQKRNCLPMQIGKKLPAFKLADHRNVITDIYELKSDKNLVVYFYPKNESKICAAESCRFRDLYQEFTDADTVVVGVNNSMPYQIKSFKENHRLPFTLLSDPGLAVHKLFDVPAYFGITGRETFVFDREGVLVYQFNSFFNGQKHAASSLKKLTGK